MHDESYIEVGLQRKCRTSPSGWKIMLVSEWELLALHERKFIRLLWWNSIQFLCQFLLPSMVLYWLIDWLKRNAATSKSTSHVQRRPSKSHVERRPENIFANCSQDLLATSLRSPVSAIKLVSIAQRLSNASEKPTNIYIYISLILFSLEMLFIYSSWWFCRATREGTACELQSNSNSNYVCFPCIIYKTLPRVKKSTLKALAATVSAVASVNSMRWISYNNNRCRKSSPFPFSTQNSDANAK